MHKHETDHNLLRRISGISIANTVVGTAEFIAGIITNSSVLTMAGVHDVSDGALYAIKRKAASECDPVKKHRLRRRGAIALMGAALSFGSFEIAQDLLSDHHQPEAAAAAVGIVAAAANIGAAAVLHGKRHHHDALDSWRHVAEVDVPGSLITLIAAPLSVKYPVADIAGAALHMALALRVSSQTLVNVKEDISSYDIC